ncbi:hypothetical protein SAMN05444370_11739 [Rubrimonas cliftonensis]|uniref:Uncharacterized protein n=1 Tax=Rubrimonas cliftonensis TaxID=89524 RepID=A0A1H4F026_9RHOB|nr:hypothetical protein SAMN05444370_11739 [Rubrimonas cliftonensis]
MKGRRTSRRTVYRGPIQVFLVSLAGLVAALLFDGGVDVVAALMVGAPLLAAVAMRRTP